MPVDSTRAKASAELQLEKLRPGPSPKDPGKPVRRALTRKVAFEQERPHHSLIPDVGALDREVARQRDIYDHRPAFTGLDGAVLKFPRPDRELTHDEKLARARWLLEPMGVGDPDHLSPEGKRLAAELARLGGVDGARSLRNYLPVFHVATELSRRSLEMRGVVERFLSRKGGDFPPRLAAATRDAAALPEVEPEQALLEAPPAEDQTFSQAIDAFRNGGVDAQRLVATDDMLRSTSSWSWRRLVEGLTEPRGSNTPDAVRAAWRALARGKIAGADLSEMKLSALRNLDPGKALSTDLATLATVRRLARAFGWSEDEVQFQNRRLSEYSLDDETAPSSPPGALEYSPSLLEPRRKNLTLPGGQLGSCGESLSNCRTALALAEHGVSSYQDSTVRNYRWRRERLRPLVDANPDMVTFYARLAELEPQDTDVQDSIRRFFASPLRESDIADEQLADIVRLALAARLPLSGVHYLDASGAPRPLVEHPRFADLEDPDSARRAAAEVAAQLQILDPRQNQSPVVRQRALQGLVKDREDAPEFWELFPSLVEARASGRLTPVTFNALDARRFLEQAAQAFGSPEAAVLVAAVSTTLSGADFAQFLVERGLPRAYAEPLGTAAGSLAAVDGETLKHLLADVLRHPRAPDVTTLPTRAGLLSGGWASATAGLPQAAPVDPSGFARAVLEHAVRLPADSAEREALIALIEGAVRDGTLHRGAVLANLPGAVQRTLADRAGAMPEAEL
ncbi:MAG TPA: hypothetical protein VH208_14680, partial [Myxococcaceae bacterium]|nr:hypothetical protein [Myxococcaceae bacterium]